MLRVARTAFDWRAYLQVIVGSALSALGYAAFQVPHAIAAGGITGLAIVVRPYLPISVGLAVWLMNVPMLALGFRHLGRWTFLARTVLAVTIFSSVSDALLAWLPLHADRWPLTDNVLLAAVYAGVLGGLGLGLVFRAGSSLGGTGVLGRILQARWGVPLSSIYLYTDGAIIALAGLVLGWESALVALVTLFLSGVASDHALEGPSTVRTAFIVTARPELVASSLISALGRGTTCWQGVRGQDGASMSVLFCTVHRPQVQQLKSVLRTADPDAFVTITLSHQAYGHGFEARTPKQ